jgi:hypothetical protein
MDLTRLLQSFDNRDAKVLIAAPRGLPDDQQSRSFRRFNTS